MARKAARSSRPRRRKAPAAAAPAAAATKLVASWEDDPGDPNVTPAPAPIQVPAPTLSASPLPTRIGGKAPAVKVYQPGSPDFRYYACASALRRGSDFWGSIVPGIAWEVGKTLPVILDDGVDLNAFYTRGGMGDAAGLHFFHQTVGTRTYYSGESPDVVCHEMGHAVLDAVRPQLWDAQTIEVAAFHESFGDMSALLTALQVDSFRQRVLTDTQGVLNRNSRLSRLAEQLGAAIRVDHPDAVDRDSLRNAVNSFFYRDPQTLPPSAPANSLSSEPHSFSRVFTAGFLDALAGMFKTKGDGAGGDDLVATTRDAALLLIAGVKAAPVVPDYYSQVAAHMLDAGEAAPFSGKYRDVIKSAFVRRGILSLQAAATVMATPRPSRRASVTASALAPLPSHDLQLPLASISAASYGLSGLVLKVRAAEQPKKFAVTSASLSLGPADTRSAQSAAESFTDDLFQRGRVDVETHAHREAGLVHPHVTKTHVVVKQGADLVLRRRTFDCGFD
jgi:hypothetical protein